MPRGGTRPGAGAPKGNLNGLKTGAHSPRVRAVLRALAENPESRAVFLALAHRGILQRARTREMVLALARLMHDRPIAEEARRRLREIADDHEEHLREDHVAGAVRSYERATREKLHVDRLDAELDRLAISDLRARLAVLQARARDRRLAAQMRRASVRLARASLHARTPDPSSETAQ